MSRARGRAAILSMTGRWAPLAVLAAFVIVFSLATAKPGGDWPEYHLMARAFAKHGGPALREPADVLIRFAIPRAPNGKYYGAHFWFYSMLAAPFVGLFETAPARSLALVNALCAVGAMGYLRAAIGDPLRATLAMLLFVLCGSTFYLGYPSPELMTGAAVIVSCVAAMKNDVATAFVTAGAAATQNPSAVFLFPFIVAWWWRLRKEPTAGFAPLVAPPSRRTVPFVGLGIGLALSPYAFFQATFGKPSLLAGGIDRSLIGSSRACSLLFDLNQGMIIGVPGLFIGLVSVCALSMVGGQNRSTKAVSIALGLAAMVALMVPVLGQGNWNAGGSVTLRYAYWLAMPLLALVLLLLRDLRPSRVLVTMGAVASVQVLALVVHGPAGAKSSHVRHSRFATLVLERWPTLYNPPAEIFWERTRGGEVALSSSDSISWPPNGPPKKALVHRTGRLFCPDQPPETHRLVGSHPIPIDRGFRYVHAPFTCEAWPLSGLAWFPGLQAGTPAITRLLASGWSSPEAGGVWTSAARSTLHLVVPVGLRPRRILWGGHYAVGVSGSIVTVGGKPLGRFDLRDLALDLPDEISPVNDVLIVELEHPDAASPASQGLGADSRLLGYFLSRLALD